MTGLKTSLVSVWCRPYSMCVRIELYNEFDATYSLRCGQQLQVINVISIEQFLYESDLYLADDRGRQRVVDI
jgi:hypothetical protein